MGINHISFKETEYKGWDTYEDIFKEPEIISAVNETVKFLENSDETFTGETYGDKIRFIFTKDYGITELLKNVRESSFLKIEIDIRKIITLVLVIEDMKNLILKYPNNITDLVKINVLNIVEDAINDDISTIAEDEESDEKERTTEYSKYERLEFLIEAGFPVITTEGDIVMGYKPFDGKSSEITLVWDNNIKRLYFMDKNGKEIQETKDVGKNDSSGKEQRFGVIEGGKSGK